MHYESKVTWEVATDMLRCNPSFFGKPRHDFVLVHTAMGKYIFTQLIFMFLIEIGDKSHPIAYVQPFDGYLGPRRLKDKELNLYRVGRKPRTAAEFIPLESILRGALLIQDFEQGRENEYIVVDLIDGDLFLRIKEMQAELH